MDASKTHISILSPCRNEMGNVGPLHERVRAAMASVAGLTFDHVYIDNASTDGTVEQLRALAAANPRVKVILNNRNFGHVRSPFHGLLQVGGDAVIILASDLQDPPRAHPGTHQGGGARGFPVARPEGQQQGGPSVLHPEKSLLQAGARRPGRRGPPRRT